MPELAEVQFFLKQWTPGLGHKVVAVRLHREKRVFRDTDTSTLAEVLTGTRLLQGESRGKQIAFRFSGDSWLGIHLGMSGRLSAAPAAFKPGKHDHLVLYQRRQTLVFSDPRLFGRVRFHCGSEPPWWTNLPPAVTARTFTVALLQGALERHRRAPVKAVLLSQQVFPGIGNWMADEILWRAKIHPRTPAGDLRDRSIRALWKTARSICRTATATIGVDWSDPPTGWLIHQRWKTKGNCPVHHVQLQRETIAGRTTAWCKRCQPVGR